MSLSMHQSQRNEQQLSGGLTQSIFPRVDHALKNTDTQRALEFVASRKRMNRYRSLVDFLFCELFTEWQEDCQQFYAGEGCQLRERIRSEFRSGYEVVMLHALDVAHQRLEEKRRGNWCDYAVEVEHTLAEIAMAA